MGWSRSLRKERGLGGGIVAGCMSGMLQLFDFRQEAVAVDATPRSSHDAAARPPPPPQDGQYCTGIEAPRNSLEILSAARRVSAEEPQRRRDEQDEDVPMAFEIFTRPMASKDSTSPSTKCKSPSVVARLMGIEILPDEFEKEAGGGSGGGGAEGKDSPAANSVAKDRGSSVRKLPHPRETKLKELNRELRILEKRCENIIRQDRVLALSRSLPESPRISSARRSDAEHRLSLQIQKENVPPFANINHGTDVVPLASSPSSSTSSFSLRNLDMKRACFGSNAGRPTSPRLVPSSTSPRLAKTAKEESRHSSTSPCSPRLKLRGQEECTNKLRPRSDSQTSSSSPKGNSQKVGRLCTAPTEPKPRAAATKPVPRLGPSAKGKPRFEVSAVKGNNGGIARTGTKERSPPKIRESYVRVLDIKSGTPKKGQKPICDNLLKSHSVIPTTKAASSTILLRTPVSGVAPPPPSRSTSPAAASDVDHASLLDRPTGSSSLQLDPPLAKRPWSDSPCSSSSLHASIHDAISRPSSSSPSSAGERGSGVKDTIFVYEYIKTIFEFMGVRSNSRVSFINWYSPSHPLDPAVFIKLDAYHYGHRNHGRHHGGISGHNRQNGITMPNTRSSRRLVFHLVDEVLRERLRPHLSTRPWMTGMMMGQGPCAAAVTGKQLLGEVWTETRGFPSADCKILQDIDGLVASDVNSGHFSSPINDADAESLAESMLFRIGQDIADSLVGETVVDLLSF
ncbi:unnamed protein product [Victoria cruziana]